MSLAQLERVPSDSQTHKNLFLEGKCIWLEGKSESKVEKEEPQAKGVCLWSEHRNELAVQLRTEEAGDECSEVTADFDSASVASIGSVHQQALNNENIKGDYIHRRLRNI